MLRWIVKTSINFRYLVIIFAMLMVVYGASKLRTMPVDVFPEFAPPLVEIQTEGLGMSPVEVEELITIPMEQVLRATPGLKTIRSKSVTGLSSIQMYFRQGYDILLARQNVGERLDLTKHELPLFATPVMLQPLSATSRVMKIGITSAKYNLLDLSMIAYWKIRFRLMQVPGVANVAIWGERIKSLQIQIDPQKLYAHNISVNQVLEAASETLDFGLLPYSSAAKVRINGFLETPNQRIDIHPILPVLGPEELANIPLKKENNQEVLMKDVAEVKWDTPLLIGDAVINDGPGLMLIVEKFPWSNTLSVTHGVEAALAELKPALENIEIDSKIFRPASFIETSIYNLKKALYLGCALVIIVLIIFMYDWRVALISCTAIPLSLLTAGIFFYLRGATLNTMVLAGFVIALGAVVDDAIVDIENIVRRLRQNKVEGVQKSTFNTILDASVEVRNAIIYSTIIEVVALIPVFFMEGLSGSFFQPLAISYTIAVIASTVVALTVTPVLGFIIFNHAPLRKKESPVVLWLKRHYTNMLTRIVEKPIGSYVAVLIIALIGIVIYPFLGQELLPNFKERDFLMHWILKPGASHEEMYRMTVAASKELRSVPGVQNFGAHIGRALVADEVVGIEFTENWISLDSKAPYDESLHKIQEIVDGYPGVYRDVQTYLKERIREVLTGSSEAIIIRLFGPELEVLRKKAKEIQEAITNVPGIIDLHTELQVLIPQIQVKVDLKKAEPYGLKPGDVQRSAGTIMTGLEISDIHREGKVYDVMVWSVPTARHSIDSLKNLLIDAPNGRRVRLGDIAEVSIEPTPNVIKREGVSRRIDIGANVRGRDLGSVVHDVEKKLKLVHFPEGYYIQMVGEYAERQAAQKRLLLLSIGVIMGIYLLLQTAFRSWTLATIGILILPAALVGGIFAVLISGAVISLGSLIGFLTVLGIVARNGIMMINHFQHLEQIEGLSFGRDLVIRGAIERLSPILMTAIVTGLALVPLVITGNIPGQEIELPTAIVILGGLVTSTLLNLFIIPPLYLRYGARPS